MKKLDRVTTNMEFIEKYENASARFHPFLLSDQMNIPNSLEKKHKSFRFSNYIADKKEFLDVVNKEWKCDSDGYKMYKLVKKMKNMKRPLNKIAWKDGNLFKKVKTLEENLKKAQIAVEADSNNKYVKEKMSKILYDYNIAIIDEEKLLSQKAKVKWLSEGDRNTKYFHNVIKGKRHSSKIVGICDDQGNWFQGDNVAEQFLKNFEKFLDHNGDTEQIENAKELFSNKISKNDSEFMVRNITNAEIKEAIFGIEDEKALGPDGFTAVFFKKSWRIVGRDVCDAVQEFFNTNKLLREVNATLITLVPKTQQPNRVSDYRPIACCNVIYKCISKIITNRLQGCLEKLVNLNQSAFVPGRVI
ncbi:RNA-directed DNA polymerase, eukaryota, reverse transcriptase zinc-binding domain protein [Tanacetum coccineum]